MAIRPKWVQNKLGSSCVGALKKHPSEEHRTNVNNLKAHCNFFSRCNATSSNSDSSLSNYPGEATSHSESNIY